jgi:hypothetical protein
VENVVLVGLVRTDVSGGRVAAIDWIWRLHFLPKRRLRQESHGAPSIFVGSYYFCSPAVSRLRSVHAVVSVRWGGSAHL